MSTERSALLRQLPPLSRNAARLLADGGSHLIHGQDSVLMTIANSAHLSGWTEQDLYDQLTDERNRGGQKVQGPSHPGSLDTG